jgi:hypothetical protein
MSKNEPESGYMEQTDGGIPAVVDIDPDQVASPALRRLLEEVRNEDIGCSTLSYGPYDRVHNKHNR